MHKFKPIVARYLGGAFRQAENARASWRQFDKPCMKLHDKCPDPRFAGKFELRIALGQSDFGFFALGDVDGVAENADRFAGRRVVNGTAHGYEPSKLPVRSDDARLEIELIAATDGSVPLDFDPLDVIRMGSVTKIRVTFYSTGLEPKDGLELGSKRNQARA